MTKKEIKNALTECFDKTIDPHLFKPDTADRRLQILCEFVELCAERGHGVQVEEIYDGEAFRGIQFIHESGLEGEILIHHNLTFYNNKKKK